MGKVFIIVLVIAGIFFSCGFDQNIDSVTIGEGFITSEASVSVIDTFTVGMSTVLLDSVRTSGGNVIWAGTYPDAELGVVTASSFFTFGVPSVMTVQKKDLYDSLVLVMNYSSVFYGDTLAQQTLNVYRLNEELATDDNGYLWNTSSIGYYNTPIGSKTFMPHPGSKGKLSIRLSDELGSKFFDMMKNDDDSVSSTEIFRKFFKGVTLKAGKQSSSIIEFKGDTSVSMVMHFHRIGLEKEAYTNSFSLTETNAQFNRVITDRQGTPLQNIRTRKEDVPSALSGHKTYAQSGTGLLTRVDFPTMQRLMESDRKYVLLKAELILIPELGSYDKVELPSQLVLYHSDRTNQVVSEIVGSDQSIIAAVLNIDKAYHESTYYKFDITDFITTEIADAYFDTEHGLLIGETSSKMGFSLNRVVFSDHKNSAYKPLVKLYFMFYK